MNKIQTLQTIEVIEGVRDTVAGARVTLRRLRKRLRGKEFREQVLNQEAADAQRHLKRIERGLSMAIESFQALA